MKIGTVVIMLFLFATCNRTNSGLNSPSLKTMEDLKVSDGFDFSMVKKVNIDLTFLNGVGAVLPGVLIKIYGVPTEGNPDRFYSGISTEEGQLRTQFEIPSYFSVVLIETQYKGVTQQFNYKVQEKIQEEIVIGD